MSGDVLGTVAEKAEIEELEMRIRALERRSAGVAGNGADDLQRLQRGIRNLAFGIERDQKIVRVQLDALNGTGGEDVARLQRGIRNLAFQLEQSETARREAFQTLGERLEALEAEPAPTQEPAGPPEPAPAQPDPEAARQLAGVRRRLASLEAAVQADRQSAGQAADERREVIALRRQVTELHRSIAELRVRELKEGGRRRTLQSAVAAPFVALRRLVGGPRGKSPKVAKRSTQRRPLKIRLRRARRRLAQLPTRTKRRTMRIGRLTRAWFRDRFFSRRLGRLQHHKPKELKIPARYLRPIELQDPPTISVVTPSYNQGRFIERTIKSVIDQDYPQLEYIVQDGGSDDETAQVLEAYSSRLHHYEMRDDDGQGHAINLGFEHASGEVMAYLNSDDVLLPGALHYVARYLQMHPEVDLVYGHRVLIDEQDRDIGRWVMPRHDDEVLSWADFVPQETMFWRRDLWERSGGAMDESWMVALDWDLLLRFRDAGANAVRLPRFTGAFRVHEVQKTSAWMDEYGSAEMGKLRRRSLGHEPTPPELRKGIRRYMRRHHILQKAYRAHLVRY